MMEPTETTGLLVGGNQTPSPFSERTMRSNRWSTPQLPISLCAADETENDLSVPNSRTRATSMLSPLAPDNRRTEEDVGMDDLVVTETETPGKTTVYELLKDRMDMTQRARQRDNQILLRINLIMANIVVCITLAIMILQVEWHDREVYFRDVSIPDNCAETSQCLFDSWYSTHMKIVVSILTIVNELQFSELLRKRVHNRIEYERDKQIMQEKMRWKSKRITQSMLRRVRLLRSPLFRTVYERYRGRSVRTRMLIFLPHPIPLIGTFMDKGLCLFMFARLYWICVVVRAYNPVYRRRDQATRQTAFRNQPRPVFTVTTIMRMYFHESPIKWILCFMTVGMLFFGYGIYLYEREAALKFTLMHSFFLSLECMLTGYPADAYEDYMPTTWPGKFMCIFALCWGLFLFALLIDYVHSNMQLDDGEVRALNWVQNSQLWQSIRNESAMLIQAEWRRYKFECECEDVDSDDEKYVHGIAILEKNEDRHIRQLRTLKRERARLSPFVPLPEERSTTVRIRAPDAPSELIASQSMSPVSSASLPASRSGALSPTTQPLDIPSSDTDILSQSVSLLNERLPDSALPPETESVGLERKPSAARLKRQSSSYAQGSSFISNYTDENDDLNRTRQISESGVDGMSTTSVPASRTRTGLDAAEVRAIIKKEVRYIIEEKMTEVIHEAVADAVAMAQAACIENMQMLLEQQHSSSASSDSGRSDHSDCPSDDALRPKGSRSRTHPHISTRTYHTINSPNTGVGGGTGPYARSHAQTHVLGSSHPHRGRAEVKTGKKEKKGKGTRVRARGSGSNAGTSHRTHPRQYASSDHSQVRMDGPDYFNPTGNHGNFPL